LVVSGGCPGFVIKEGIEVIERNKGYRVRLSEEEYGRLKANAQTMGVSIAELIRRTAIYGEKISPTIIDMEPIRKMLCEMSREGGNLNQLAHEVNTYGFSPKMEKAINDELEAHCNVRQELVALISDIRGGRLNV
jgi:hypothetical protein